MITNYLVITNYQIQYVGIAGRRGIPEDCVPIRSSLMGEEEAGVKKEGGVEGEGGEGGVEGEGGVQGEGGNMLCFSNNFFKTMNVFKINSTFVLLSVTHQNMKLFFVNNFR